MRKRNIEKTFDNVFWTLIYLAPLIAYFIYLGTYLANPTIDYDANTNFVSLLKFGTFWARCDISVYQSQSIIYSTISTLFGTGGIIQLFGSGSFVHLMCTYFICCNLLHLVVDILLVIPRVAHKLLDKTTKEF